MKKKLCLQMGVCALILAAAYLCPQVENKTLSGYWDKAQAAIMEEITYEEIKLAASVLSENLKGAPKAVAAAARTVTEESRYGVPIDEKSDSKIKQVHAVAGGRVEKSGWDSKIGLYVKIRHQQGRSVYGNLAQVGVIESERVQRGEIIGSFDTTCGKDFFYELDED